jgi:predicted nucleic acid-binding protein
MMFLHLDSSALVKRYIHEPHSEEVAHLMDETLAIGTSAISRVEVGAALARAARGNRLDAEGARGAQEQFAEDWPDLGMVPVTDTLLTRAERLAWKHGLRAYDAVQLAAALVCEETIKKLDESVLFGCFDNELTAAANKEGLRTWPD